MDFNRFQLAQDLKQQCPYLWRLIQLLLNASAVQSAVLRLEESNSYLTELVTAPSLCSRGAKETDLPEKHPQPDAGKNLDIWIIDPSALQGRQGSSDQAHVRQSELIGVVS